MHDGECSQLVCFHLIPCILDTRANASSKKVSIVTEEQKSPLPAAIAKRPPGVAYLMLDKLRNSTLTSFDRCVTGFVKMMKVLADADPQMAGLSNELIRELLVGFFFLYYYPT